MKETIKIVGTSFGWAVLIFIIVLVVALAAVVGIVVTQGYPFGDGFLGFDGKVYEWSNAPANTVSKFYIVEETTDTEIAFESIMQQISDNVSIVPMKDAVVNVIQDWQGGSTFQVSSNYIGDFGYMSSTAPGEGKVLFTVTKPGYIEAKGEAFFDGAGSYTLVVLLVKQRN